MRIEAVIFDVDGTIWDSAERVAESWTEAFSDFPETKGIEVSAGELASYMGLTMEKIEAKILPGIEPMRRREMMNYAVDYENRYLVEHPGVFYPSPDILRQCLQRQSFPLERAGILRILNASVIRKSPRRRISVY